MTREEQIEVALKSQLHQYDNNIITLHDKVYNDAFEDGFKAGAEWADANNYWHKYPEEFPSENGIYIVSDGESVIPAFYNTTRFEHYDYDIIDNIDSEILYWMELPKIPKFN